MIDLEKISGLPISVDKNYQLVFREPLPEVKPSVRKFSDMLPVLMDKDAKPNFETDEMYYMYRDIHLLSDEETIRTNNIRYDITVIPPGKIGKEFNKTVGHYHPNDPKGFAFPEVYEVLHGQALFLIQKTDATFNDIHSIICIRASTGEKVIYPPYYGHIIVNIGSDVLVTANWVADKFNSVYQPVADHKGMGYYVVSDPDRGFAFVRNPNYSSSPSVREITTEFTKQFPIAKDGPMYRLALNNPKIVEFLNIPEKYAVELSTITS
jgi:glucose-6-phosphate isomerase